MHVKEIKRYRKSQKKNRRYKGNPTGNIIIGLDPIWSQCIILFVYCWIWVANIF